MVGALKMAPEVVLLARWFGDVSVVLHQTGYAAGRFGLSVAPFRPRQPASGSHDLYIFAPGKDPPFPRNCLYERGQRGQRVSAGS